MKKTVLKMGSIGLCLATGLALAAAVILPIARFSAGDWQDWKRKSLQGETDYQLVEREGRRVLQADSRGAASGLYREIRVDLERTPYLNWSWAVGGVLSNVDERTKGGDDYPARVYVVVSGGAAFWKTRSLVYVWSSHQPAGSLWKSAYTGNAGMIAVRSGAQRGWFQEKRNVRADFQRLFGDTVQRIDGVAVMTDTDDSGQQAMAWYGDIYFSAE